MDTLTRYIAQWDIPSEDFDQDWLAQTIELATELIDEMGDLGREFNAAVANLDIPEVLFSSETGSGAAAYRDFVAGIGFKPQIQYYSKSITGPYEFMSARFHEYIHAMQVDNAPVLHALPLNPQSQVMFLPSQSLKLMELMEIDAYAKQGWLMNEFTKAHGLDYNSAIQANTVSEQSEGITGNSMILGNSLFEKIDTSNEYPDLWSKLVELGATILYRIAIPQPDNAADVPFMQVYHAIGVERYNHGLENWPARLPHRRNPQVFTVLQSDAIKIGNSFGPNIFEVTEEHAMTPVFSYPAQLTFVAQKAVQSLNASIGIEDESALDLFSFEDALARVGHTAESFMQESKDGIEGIEDIPIGLVLRKTEKHFKP